MSKLSLTKEMQKAAHLTEEELLFINDMTEAIFNQAKVDQHSPLVLIALCGSIGANVIDQSEGELSVKAVTHLMELAVSSQFTDVISGADTLTIINNIFKE